MGIILGSNKGRQKGGGLSSLICDAPPIKDASVRSFAQRRIEKRKRKEHEGSSAIVKKPCGVTSYDIPRSVTKNPKEDGPRIYRCSIWKLMSLEKINWMKAHSIEHIVVLIEGDYPLPDWWKETGMTFRKFSNSLDKKVRNYCLQVLEKHPDDCLLIAE